MGLFDYIKCKYPLPDVGANECLFQTKDTPMPCLEMYEISEDGFLYYEDHDTEDRSDKSKPGLAGLAGCMTAVNKRLVKIKFTGSIDFGDDQFEYCGFFVDGKLREIIKIE